jgi:hypothetical protein
LTIYGGAALFGTLAVVLSRNSLQFPLVFSAILLLNALAGVAVLEKLPYQRQELRERVVGIPQGGGVEEV